MTSEQEIAIQDIYKARSNIKPFISRTPIIRSETASKQAGMPVYLKLENLQYTGSFKVRGAANELINLPPTRRRAGVIAVSSGNHGKALSYIASKMGIHVVVCLSKRVPRAKIEGVREMGGDVVIAGETFDQASEHAYKLQAERGLSFIEPFDDPDLIAGQGTIAIDVIEDIPNVECVIVPMAGGGLISGIAIAMKTINPKISVIGVSMDSNPIMYESLRLGKVVTGKEELPSLADALIGGIGTENHYTFGLCQKLVDDTVLVSEEEIAHAMYFMLEHHHMLVEGAGAVGLAAVLSHHINQSAITAIIISGCNIQAELALDIFREFTHQPEK